MYVRRLTILLELEKNSTPINKARILFFVCMEYEIYKCFCQIDRNFVGNDRLPHFIDKMKK